MISSYQSILRTLKKELRNTAIFILFILLSILLYFLYFTVNENYLKFENEMSKNIEKVMHISTDSLTDKYRLTIDRIITNKKVKELVKNKERIKLLLEVEDEWNFIVRDNIYVRNMHFHLPDGTSFLRLHNTEKHSDYLSTLRPMIKQIHNTKVEYAGFETGKHTFSYRIIKPIFDSKEQYLGALEIGISPNFIIDQIKEILGFNGFFITTKEDIKKYMPGYDLEIGNYVFPNIYDNKEISIMKLLPKEYNFNKSIIKKINDITYFYQPIDLFNFVDEPVSKIIFFKDISNFVNKQKELIVLSLLTLLIISIVAIIFLIFFVQHFAKTINAFFTKIINKEKDEKNFLKEIENSSKNFIVTCSSENILSMNQSALEFFNFENIESFKKQYECICDLFIVKADYIQKYNNEILWMDYIINNNNIQHKVLLQKDNSLCTFIVHAKKLSYHDKIIYMATFTDITEIEKLNKDFEYLIKRNQFAEKGANIALWDWDLNTDKVFYSSIWKRLLGYRNDEISDNISEWYSRIHEEDKDKVIKDLDDHFKLKTKYFINTHRVLQKNGSYIFASFRGQAIYDKNNNPYRMVGIYVDITFQFQAKEKMKEQERMMIAQSKQAAMGEMISMIAHQWRQPISSVAMGVNNILLDIEIGDLNKDEVKEECVGILDQTKYLSQTIDDFRNFFKEDKQKVLVSIEEIIENALSLMENILKTSNIKLERECFNTEKIETFPNEILQIILNLIKNSKEVMLEKNIKNRLLKIYTSQDDMHIYIDVEDNAGGIDEKNIHKIFEAYFTTKEEYNGTGLGLYMSRKVARDHLKGDLTFKNTDTGVIFTLSICKD